MRATGFLLAAAMAFGAGNVALADDASDEEIARITAALAEIQCEMDPDEIDKEDGSYALDDVFCADGQFDVKMDADFNVTEKNAE